VAGVAGGLAAGAMGAPAAAVPGPATSRLRPISMAMHIHGPFSEGQASFESHLQQAREHDVDVVWWTDHDFRVAAADHRRAVHFTGPTELEGELAWKWARQDEGTLVSPVAEFVESPHSGDDGPMALRLAATGGDDAGGSITYAGWAWNSTYNAAIGDTTLELDVLPEKASADAVLAFQVDLSYHPARCGRPAGIYSLRYEIGGVTERRHSTDGLLGRIQLPAAAGESNRLRFTPVEDVRRLWPDLVTGDNALRNIRVGVAVGAGASASFVVDRLVFRRSRREGQCGEDMRTEVLAAYAKEYRDVAHYRAYEISLVRHMNWYGGDQTLPEFPSPPYRNNDPAVTESMVEFLHKHGGIVCWNHPMDIEKKGSLAKLMIERNNLGADLMEINRDPQDDLLWVLDVAARNAIFFTAVGSSDDHDGNAWLDRPLRGVTYTWARSTALKDLIASLKAGASWFVDPVAYRGAVDIRHCGATIMGGVAVTRARRVELELVFADLPLDATIEVITGVVDRPGLADIAPKTSVTTVPAAQLQDDRYVTTVTPGDGLYVRTQVRTAQNTVVAVSNPCWLLREAPPGGIPAERRRHVD
jgi:hypothetical protein